MTEPVIDPESQIEIKTDHHNHENCNHNHGTNPESTHQHGNHRNHNHHGSPYSKKFIVFFTVFMPTNVVILEYGWLTEPLRNNYFEYYFSLAFITFIYIMAMISYYIAIKANNTPPKKEIPEPTHLYYPEIYKNNLKCTEQKCQGWKPQRTHHCRQCGVCTIRMDHHCPWTVNCVGARNHKAFLLFCTYMGLGGSQFCYRTLYYIMSENDNMFWNHSSLFFVYWIATAIILFPMSIMLVSLMIFHFLGALSNVTTLENMKGMSINCFMSTTLNMMSAGRINIFDQGFVSNLSSFFGNSLFLFWFPTEIMPPKDGTEFNSNPPLTRGEYLRVIGNRDFENIDEFYEMKEKLMKEYLEKGEKEFKDKSIMHEGRILGTL